MISAGTARSCERTLSHFAGIGMCPTSSFCNVASHLPCLPNRGHGFSMGVKIREFKVKLSREGSIISTFFQHRRPYAGFLWWCQYMAFFFSFGILLKKGGVPVNLQERFKWYIQKLIMDEQAAATIQKYTHDIYEFLQWYQSKCEENLSKLLVIQWRMMMAKKRIRQHSMQPLPQSMVSCVI